MDPPGASLLSLLQNAKPQSGNGAVQLPRDLLSGLQLGASAAPPPSSGEDRTCNGSSRPSAAPGGWDWWGSCNDGEPAQQMTAGAGQRMAEEITLSPWAATRPPDAPAIAPAQPNGLSHGPWHPSLNGGGPLLPGANNGALSNGNDQPGAAGLQNPPGPRPFPDNMHALNDMFQDKPRGFAFPNPPGAALQPGQVFQQQGQNVLTPPHMNPQGQRTGPDGPQLGSGLMNGSAWPHGHPAADPMQQAPQNQHHQQHPPGFGPPQQHTGAPNSFPPLGRPDLCRTPPPGFQEQAQHHQAPNGFNGILGDRLGLPGLVQEGAAGNGYNGDSWAAMQQPSHHQQANQHVMQAQQQQQRQAPPGFPSANPLSQILQQPGQRFLSPEQQLLQQLQGMGIDDTVQGKGVVGLDGRRANAPPQLSDLFQTTTRHGVNSIHSSGLSNASSLFGQPQQQQPPASPPPPGFSSSGSNLGGLPLTLDDHAVTEQQRAVRERTLKAACQAWAVDPGQVPNGASASEQHDWTPRQLPDRNGQPPTNDNLQHHTNFEDRLQLPQLMQQLQLQQQQQQFQQQQLNAQAGHDLLNLLARGNQSQQQTYRQLMQLQQQTQNQQNQRNQQNQLSRQQLDDFQPGFQLLNLLQRHQQEQQRQQLERNKQLQQQYQQQQQRQQDQGSQQLEMLQLLQLMTQQQQQHDQYALIQQIHHQQQQQQQQGQPEQRTVQGAQLLALLQGRREGTMPVPAGSVGPGVGMGLGGGPGALQPRNEATMLNSAAGMMQPQRWKGRGPASRPWDLIPMNQALEQLVSSLLPAPGELSALNQALEGVSALLKKEFPHGKVKLYGSAANGLCISRTNDIDVCLDLGQSYDSHTEKAAAVAKIGAMLTDANMDKVVTLTKARVPVVKFVFPSTGTSVDVTINNMLPLANTKLLATYAAVDQRLRDLVVVVKHWAKTRRINDTYRGTLSSYAYVLLCIGLLQQRSPPILPVLQQMPRAPNHVAGWDCSFCDDVDQLKEFGQNNKETLAELVAAFFEYWGRQHDYNNAVLSIRTGLLVSKKAKDWTRRHDRDRHLVCIEDPFELSHDLGRCVDWQSVRTLRSEFERAAQILATEKDPLPMLLTPVPARD